MFFKVFFNIIPSFRDSVSESVITLVMGFILSKRHEILSRVDLWSNLMFEKMSDITMLILKKKS